MTIFTNGGNSKKSQSSYIISLFDGLFLVKFVQFFKNLAFFSLPSAWSFPP